MPRSFITVITLILGGAFPTAVYAQDPSTPSAIQHVVGEIPCGSCHSCENPTPGELCLRPCVRTTPEAIAEKLKRQKRGPDIVIMDELEDLYLPVPFDHKGHANMAEMTQGCVVCHHYTPPGAAAQQTCKSCHEVAHVREDMQKPSLKAAYHRQCLACHREWSHETACEVCHPPRAGRDKRGGLTRNPTKDDIMGQMHPPIPEPEVEVYQTKYKYVLETNVFFRHKEHVHRFGLRCVDCHREDNCLRCHEKGKKHTQKVKTLEEHHRPCSDCHTVDKEDQCDSCHWEKDRPQPGPFDHASTGWPLSRHHINNSCRACHTTVPFKKLDRDCNTCHQVWSPDSFNHEITGQTLNENHAEADCEECHLDRKFEQPPSCENCHEEEEGIDFPSKRPGPITPVHQPGG